MGLDRAGGTRLAEPRSTLTAAGRRHHRAHGRRHRGRCPMLQRQDPCHTTPTWADPRWSRAPRCSARSTPTSTSSRWRCGNRVDNVDGHHQGLRTNRRGTAADIIDTPLSRHDDCLPWRADQCPRLAIFQFEGMATGLRPQPGPRAIGACTRRPPPPGSCQLKRGRGPRAVSQA